MTTGGNEFTFEKRYVGITGLPDGLFSNQKSKLFFG
jgi:hypothetical protein